MDTNLCNTTIMGIHHHVTVVTPASVAHPIHRQAAGHTTRAARPGHRSGRSCGAAPWSPTIRSARCSLWCQMETCGLKWVCLKIVYPYTQWFSWSLSLLNGYNWGYTPFSDIPRWKLAAWNGPTFICTRRMTVNDGCSYLPILFPGPLLRVRPFRLQWGIRCTPCGSSTSAIVTPWRPSGVDPATETWSRSSWQVATRNGSGRTTHN